MICALQLQEFQAVHRLGSVVSCHVESGSCGMLLPARYSVKDRLIVQVHSVVAVDP